MKNCLIKSVILLLSLTTVIFSCKGNPDSSIDIMDLFPEKGETGDWSPVDTPQKYVGEELWEFINGGAEVYHEYGFSQAAAQEFKNRNGKSINIEIYEMKNPESAYGVYTFKTSAKGKKLDIGSDAVQEDYYMNFWKNKFVITLIGFDTETETIGGLITIANTIDAKIKSSVEKPALVNLLPSDDLKEIKYLLGYIGLFNYYEFGSQNIFNIKEGVIGDYSDYKVFVFKYENRNESKKRYENAREFLKKSNDFSAFLNIGDVFTVTDNKDVRLFCKQKNEYIVTIIGKGQKEAEDIFSGLNF